jgi:hypothetical protein
MFKVNMLAVLLVGCIAVAFFAPIGTFVVTQITHLARVVGGGN